jgi:hypothetical protein
MDREALARINLLPEVVCEHDRALGVSLRAFEQGFERLTSSAPGRRKPVGYVLRDVWVGEPIETHRNC